MGKTIKAFWSYVHDDDKAESGRIVQLGKDIAAQYEMITGEKIDLFIDRSGLSWGDEWKKIIDDNLATFAYFIPVVTTRYFNSVECRRELTTFAEKAQNLGLESLIMPILYCETRQLNDEENNDKAVELVRKFQWEPWTDTRFEELHSSAYRRAVYILAKRLSDTGETVEIKPKTVIDSKSDIVLKPQSSDIALGSSDISLKDDDDETAGFLDNIADMETAFNDWTAIMNSISAEVAEVSHLTENATTELNAIPTKLGVTSRLPIFKKLALKLDPHAEKISELGNQFTEEAYKVDQGVRAIVKLYEMPTNEDRKADAAVFKNSILELNKSAQNGLNGLKDMLNPMEPLEAMSRDMRRPLRKIRRGVTSMYESRSIIEDWTELVSVMPDTPLDVATSVTDREDA